VLSNNRINGQANFKALRERATTHQIEQVGDGLRAMMPFIKKGNTE